MQKARVFPALIKHWRGRRGLSQLDLALAADVSARHVSFLETGRAQPSQEMILRLASALNVPLRDQNALLLAAGFPEAFPEPSIEKVLPSSPIHMAIERMLEQQEPYPLTVLDARYDVIRLNRGAQRLFAHVLEDPSAVGPKPNIFHVLFDPRLARKFVLEWERVAKSLLMRLHRECLEKPSDTELAALTRSLLEYPDVPKDWQVPDLSAPSEPCLSFRLKRGPLELAFLTTVTVFNAPQNVTLEELRIESYFPLDEATRATCERLARD